MHNYVKSFENMDKLAKQYLSHVLTMLIVVLSLQFCFSGMMKSLLVI